MTDRKNVINHFQDVIEASGDNNKWRFVRVDIIENAIELLKEQEAVEPTVSGIEDHDGHGSWWYQCGKCKMPIDYGDKFCRRCGQAVKWDG